MCFAHVMPERGAVQRVSICGFIERAAKLRDVTDGMAKMVDQRDWGILPRLRVSIVGILFGAGFLKNDRGFDSLLVTGIEADLRVVTAVGCLEQQRHAGSQWAIQPDPLVIQRIPVPCAAFMDVLSLSHGNRTQLITGGGA